MTFDAIIFDCDGVLVNSEELGLVVELELLSAHGLPYERHEFIDLYMGLTDREAQQILEREFQERLGHSAPDAFGPAVIEKRMALYEKELIAVAGAADLIDDIDLPLAVASSSKEHLLFRKLTMVGLLDRFQPHIYSGEHVERGKPAPDLFLHTAEKLDVAPDKCLVIEDSVNGVKAGVAAGMTVWGFLGGGHLDAAFGPKLSAAGAGEVFGTHADIRAALRKM